MNAAISERAFGRARCGCRRKMRRIHPCRSQGIKGLDSRQNYVYGLTQYVCTPRGTSHENKTDDHGRL